MDKVVSVIIPVYNVEKYLSRCLNSVINQTYKNLEIILIDDGSTDNSGKICDEYKKKDDRIVVVHKENAGVSSARNKGLEIAKGEYIGFIDSDDYIENNMYEECVKKFEFENVDIVKVAHKIIYYNIKRNRIYKDNGKFEGEMYKKNMYDAALKEFEFRNIWGCLIKREIINDIKFEESLNIR